MPKTFTFLPLNKQYGLIFLFAVACDSIIIDQVIKWLVLRGNISWPRNGIIDSTIIWNQGMAFGIILPLVVWITLVGLLGYIMIRYFIEHALYNHWVTIIAGGLIVGGAISNIIDRIAYGAVLDFIDLHWWPVFNLADSFIVIGAVLLILWPVKETETITGT